LRGSGDGVMRRLLNFLLIKRTLNLPLTISTVTGDLKLERKSSIKNQRGSALIFVYLLILVLLILGIAIVSAVINEGRVAERERRTRQAFYIAEAGMEQALYDLRQDFLNDSSSPSWSDGNIHGYSIGPNTSSYYSLPYTDTSLNGGNYSVQLKNSSSGSAVWVKSTGSIGDVSQTIQVYAIISNLSIWNNAIFAGAGAAGAMVNGNVNIRGSVHILGTGLSSTDLAIDLGGTAELVGNNYNSLAAGLKAKVPTLPTTVVNGETVSTLNAKLRVKHGIVGLSGSSTVGEPNVAGNSDKEFVDGSYVTDGFSGNQGTNSVYSDNGWSNGYDLGDAVTFPSLSDPYPGYANYQAYLRANALVINDATQLAELANITPSSSFSYSGANGGISANGGALTISGIVYIEGGTLGMNKAGSDKTLTYSGEGSILATGNVSINVNLVTNGNNSFPANIMGVMTPGNITFNEANIDVMGLFYGESQIISQKQTDVLGTFISNYFNMGTNVPSIFQVPDTVNNLPPGMIGGDPYWTTTIVSWEKL